MPKVYTYPAFCDTHMHLVEYGMLLAQQDLRHMESIEAMIRVLKKAAEKAPQQEVIHAFGWNQDQWVEGRFPTAGDLDQVSSEKPVLLSRICGHVTAVNSVVLKALNIVKGNVPEISGGSIDIDAMGNPTGIFRERARLLLREAGYYNGTKDMVRSHVLRAQEDLLAKGIVEVHSDDLTCYPNLSGLDILEVLTEMAVSGALKIRLIAQAQGDPEVLVKSNPNHPMFRIGSLKLFTDGSLGARTAHLLEPYADAPETCGIAIQDRADLQGLFEKSYAWGLPITVHAIGDAAIDRVLSAFEGLKMLGASDDYLGASGIVHCQIVNLDLLRRMAALKLRAYIQPIFLHEDALMVVSRIGAQRASQSYAFKTMWEMGIPIYFGSDAPIDTPDVIKSMHCAVKRQTLHEEPVSYRPEEALSVSQVLMGYTRTSLQDKVVILDAPLERCIEKPHSQHVLGVEKV